MYVTEVTTKLHNDTRLKDNQTANVKYSQATHIKEKKKDKLKPKNTIKQKIVYFQYNLFL